MVHVLQTPTITVVPPNPLVCNGGLGITLYANGANNYTWKGNPIYLDAHGDSVSVNPTTVNPPQVYTYSVTGTGANGCVSAPVVTTVTVITAPHPFYSARTDTICAGQSTLLFVDSMPITSTYTWTAPPSSWQNHSGNPWPVTPIYSGIFDTTFNFQVQASYANCPVYPPANITIHVKPLPKINVAPDTLYNCNQLGDTLNAATLPAFNVGLLWMPRGGTNTIQGLTGAPIRCLLTQ